MGFWTALTAVAFALIAAPIGGFAILFYCFPHILIKQFVRYQAFRSGMRIKFVSNGKDVFCYGEKNQPQPNKTSIVFIHGFTSSKDQWISCFKGLPADIHIIAVDLPGHGESTQPDETSDLSFETAADLVLEFLNLVFLGDVKVHLVGNSLGGAIAGLFAAKYPDKVERVSLICPAMQTPVDTQIQLQIKSAAIKSADQITSDDFLLLTNNLQDIKEMLLSICFSKDVVKFHDQLLHVSGAEILQGKLPDCRHVDIIDRCGHAIHLDRPGAQIKHILKFYQEGENRKDK